jgi:hypothetical protein
MYIPPNCELKADETPPPPLSDTSVSDIG